jgi:hypothetical protein
MGATIDQVHGYVEARPRSCGRKIYLIYSVGATKIS